MRLTGLGDFIGLERHCPYCDHVSKTYIPNVWIPVLDSMPAVSWCSMKMGFHIRRSHPHKARLLFDEGDLVEAVRMFKAQPDLEMKERFEHMEPEEIVNRTISARDMLEEDSQDILPDDTN